MPKFDDTIKEAIEKAVKRDGSQFALCKKTGISTSIMSRYLKGNVHNINFGTWNMLFPAIADFLPEEYHRTFMSWKSPEEWERFKTQYPASYREAERYNRELDIAHVAKTDPNYGKISRESQQKLNLIRTIVDELPSGSVETLKAIMRLLLADEEKSETDKEESSK